MKLMLLGGESLRKQDARMANQFAFKTAGNLPSVLVFPWGNSTLDSLEFMRNYVDNYFRSVGAGNVDFIEYDASKEIETRISDSDVIYLTGGLTSVLVERLKLLGVDALLRDYEGVIVGRSAGALALSRQSLIKGKGGTLKLFNGLGLGDFTLKVHYRPKNDGELCRLSAKRPIYAIPKGSALFCDDGVLSPIGTVYLFKDCQRIKLEPNF